MPLSIINYLNLFRFNIPNDGINDFKEFPKIIHVHLHNNFDKN